jgi:hypothetical protein
METYYCFNFAHNRLVVIRMANIPPATIQVNDDDEDIWQLRLTHGVACACSKVEHTPLKTSHHAPKRNTSESKRERGFRNFSSEFIFQTILINI